MHAGNSSGPSSFAPKILGSIYERLRRLRGVADLLIALSESPDEFRLLRTPTIGLDFGQEMSVNLDALEQELERLDVVSQRGV